MVVKSKSFIICLHPNPGVDKYYDKDNAMRICRLYSCASHHVPTLKGSKETQVANCSMTFVRLEGSFGRCSQKYIQDKFRRCNLATKGGAGLLDGQSYLTSWKKDRRDRKKKEVAKKLGEINVGQTIKVADNEERNLLKEGLTQEFNDKFKEFLRLGTIKDQPDGDGLPGWSNTLC